MYLVHGTLMAALLLRNSGVKCELVYEDFSAEFRRQGPTQSAAEEAAEQSDRDYQNSFTGGAPGAAGAGEVGAGAGDKFTTPTTTTVRIIRTTPELVSQKEDCDYLAYYCLKAYRTGKLCARTLYYKYQSFSNYCLLDYVNCKEGYEVWQVVHMGECIDIEPVTQYKQYVYDDDGIFDQFYVVDDW